MSEHNTCSRCGSNNFEERNLMVMGLNQKVLKCRQCGWIKR